MPTGADVLKSAQRFHLEPYDQTSPGRWEQDSGYKDCSGLVFAALVALGVTPGGTVSTSEETWATNNGGMYVSRDYALTHPGIGLSVWGYGDLGHIKLSDGKGASYGTPSDEGHCVGTERFDARGVNRYFTFPGVDYEPHVVVVSPTAAITEEEFA